MKFQINHSIEILRQTPTTLHSLLGNLSKDWTHQNEGPDSWSPFDVLGHLIHGEDTDWIPRLQIIREYGVSKPFTPFDRFAFFEKSKGKTIHELLDTFARLREDNLEILINLKLGTKEYSLTGTHPDFGTVTIEQLIATWAVHDLGHIRQIARTMAKQYKDAVGPWKAYLTILSE